MLDINTCFTYAYSDGSSGDFYQNIDGAEEVSENTLDLDVAGIKIAGVNPPWWIVKVGTAANNCTSQDIKLVTATNENLTSGQKVIASVRLLRGKLSAGALVINQPLPHFKYQKFLGLEITRFGGSNDTTLTIASWLDTGPQPAVTDVGITEAGS